MKLASLRTASGTTLGILDGGRLVDVAATAAERALDVPVTMEQLIAQGPLGREALADLLGGEVVTLDPDAATFAPVVADPEKILCVGINYRKHSAEFQMDVPSEPLLFGKYNNALAAHRETVGLSPVSNQYDYEAELVMVVGRRAHDVPRDRALDYVFGYTVGNDLTARDLQHRTGQWLIGKSLDQFAPTGPYLVTADSFDPVHKRIGLTKNGVPEQDATTDAMVFDCAQILSCASRYLTLEPGDLIFTGTPEGVVCGKPEGERDWIRPGDVVEATIEGIGTLTTRFA